MRWTRSACLVLVLFLVLAVPVFPQTNSTGVIAGRAMDNTSAVIPGVEVSITSPAMIGGARSSTTDETGAYQFTQLVPGVYRVSFSLPGFKTMNIDSVTITAGATMTINGPMQVSTVAEEVTVTSEVPAIDLQQATVGINWEQKKLDDLPWGRSVVSLAQMVPGIYATTYDVGGSQMGGSSNIGGRVYGRSGGEVRTYDGVAWCMNFDDFGSYEEVQLTAAAKGAESMSPGVAATYVVKSGGNAFHGTALASWEDGSFQSTNVDQNLLNQGFAPGSNNFTRYNDFNFDFGGPIKHDKLWFYSSYDNQYSGQNIAGFVTQATNQAAVYPIQLNVETVKLTYQLNSKMKLEHMQQWSLKSAPYRNASAFVPLEATQNQESMSLLGPTLKWTYIITPKMTAEAGIERSGYWWPTLPWVNSPRLDDLSTGEIRGSYLRSYLGPQRWQWNGSWSWFTDIGGKSNEIKTGTLMWWDSNKSNNYGYPNNELYDYTSQAADYAGCTGIPCNYFQRPDQVVTYDYPNYTISVVNYRSWYLNDKVNLSRKLTVNAGVRFDYYSDYLPAQGNPGTGPFAGQLNGQGGYPQGPGVAPEQLYPLTNNFPTYKKLVPRISVAYDVRGDGRLALKASFSQYAGGGTAPGAAIGTTGASVNPAATVSRTYAAGIRNGVQCWGGEIPYIPNPACQTQISGGGGSQTISPGLTTPYTNQYTTGVQYGWSKDYLIGFTAVRTFDYGGADKINLALPYSAYTGLACAPDPGRNNVGYTTDPAGGAAAGTPAVTGENPTGNNVCVYTVPTSNANSSVINTEYVNYAKGEGTKNYTAFESTFQKQHSNGWSMLFGYTADFAHINNPNETLFNPNAVLYNFQDPQWNQEIKANGAYDLPWHGIKYSATYSAQTGAWYGRSVNVKNANGTTSSVTVEQHAGRYPFVKDWDNRISKIFKIGDRQTLEAMFDLYNTLNSNVLLSKVTTNGANFNVPTAASGGATSAATILPARIFKLGVRYRF